jgi:hypothetical protein
MDSAVTPIDKRLLIFLGIRNQSFAYGLCDFMFWNRLNKNHFVDLVGSY